MKKILLLVATLGFTGSAYAFWPAQEKAAKTDVVQKNFILCYIGKTESIAYENINQVNFDSEVTVYTNRFSQNNRSSDTKITIKNPRLVGSGFTVSQDDDMIKVCTFVTGDLP